MASWDYLVVGAGPAGATLAWSLARRGYRVLVAEAGARPGRKPCGRGIPETGDLPFSVPRECVVQRIREAELYVDGRHVFTVRGVEGAIVDRTCLTETLLSETGVTLLLRAHYKPGTRTVRAGGRTVEAPPEKTIIAGGHPFYPGEKISALQYLVPGEWPDRLTIIFDTRLIGYYWVFPAGEGLVEVGVGGYDGFPGLRRRLDRFLRESRFTAPLHGRPPARLEGAMIAVGGVMRGLLEGRPVHIGEAAGYVYPLTGEGIRPSIVSAARLADRLDRGEPPAGLLREEPARGIALQRMILERVKRMRPEERAELLESIPGSLHMRVALGKATRLDLVRALARKPWLLLRLGLR